MGNIKFNREEKNEIEILKCLLQLYTSWKKELVIFSDSEKEEILCDTHTNYYSHIE